MEKFYGRGLHPLLKVFYFLATLAVSLGIILILYLYYALFYPVPTIKINQNPSKILTKTVQPGGTVVYELNFCKYTDIKATISRAIVDHYVVLLPDTTSEFNQGCRIADLSVQTPLGMPPGPYHIVTTFKYQVNPLHEIDTTVSTENFVVK